MMHMFQAHEHGHSLLPCGVAVPLSRGCAAVSPVAQYPAVSGDCEYQQSLATSSLHGPVNTPERFCIASISDGCSCREADGLSNAECSSPHLYEQSSCATDGVFVEFRSRAETSRTSDRDPGVPVISGSPYSNHLRNRVHPVSIIAIIGLSCCM